MFWRQKAAFQEGKAEKNEHVEVDQVWWVSVVRHATRVVAAAVEAKKDRVFFVFLAIQTGRWAVLGVVPGRFSARN